jgi:ketosteroid isomerase-like protein
MSSRRVWGILGIAMWSTVWLLVISLPSPAYAKTKVSPDAEIQADHKTVEEIVATFKKAEDALAERNLETLMALYSKDYTYHGLTREDIRKIWEDLFAHSHRIASEHRFSKIVAGDGKNPRAEVTCTGSFWTTDETSKRVNIDSWYEEVHYMVYEDGAWRIRGHAGDASKAPLFGTTPHPLF